MSIANNGNLGLGSVEGATVPAPLSAPPEAWVERFELPAAAGVVVVGDAPALVLARG